MPSALSVSTPKLPAVGPLTIPAPVPLTAETTSVVFASGSVSLGNTLPVAGTAASSAMLLVSATASGASLLPVMVMVSVAWTKAPRPSEVV